MSTTLQSSESLPPVRPAPATARRHEATAATVAEIYGGEHLPVLIRLPDLLRAAIVPPPTVQRSDLPAAAPPASDGASEAQPEQPQEAVTLPSQHLRRQRHVRTIRRPRTNGDSAGWLRGLGQLAMAAILAGILLVVVVTIKQWNADNAKPHSALSVPYADADAPEMDFGGPVLEPAANFRSDPDSFLGSPSSAGSPGRTLRGVLPAKNPSPSLSDSREAMGGTNGDSRMTRSVEAGGVLRGPTSASPLAGGYPSTGIVEPVFISPDAGSAGDTVGWSETISVGSARNAARPATDSQTQRR